MRLSFLGGPPSRPRGHAKGGTQAPKGVHVRVQNVDVALCLPRSHTVWCGWALGGLVMPYRKWLVLAAGLVLALSAAAIAYVMQAR